MDLRKWSENSNLRFWTCLNSKLFWVITSTDKTFKFKPFKHFLLRLYVETGTRTAQLHPSQTFSLFFLPSFTWDGCSVCLPFLSLPPPSLSFFIFLFQVSVLFTSSFLSRHSLPPFLSACQLLFKKFNHCLGCLQSILSFCLSAIHFVLFALLHCFYCFIYNFQSCPKCYLFHEFS